MNEIWRCMWHHLANCNFQSQREPLGPPRDLFLALVRPPGPVHSTPLKRGHEHCFPPRYLRPRVGAGAHPGLLAAAARDCDHGAGRVAPEARRRDGRPGRPAAVDVDHALPALHQAGRGQGQDEDRRAEGHLAQLQVLLRDLFSAANQCICFTVPRLLDWPPSKHSGLLHLFYPGSTSTFIIPHYHSIHPDVMRHTEKAHFVSPQLQHAVQSSRPGRLRQIVLMA